MGPACEALDGSPRPTLLILGASARGAAFSARRAGLQPIAADRFADRDLRQVAPASLVPPERYPEGLADISASAPAAPWIYTGALENAPDLVDHIARQRPLWGNDAPTLRAVRDPFRVADALRRAGFRCPVVRPVSDGLPRDGSWLVKPLASGGGLGISPLLQDDPDEPEMPCYFQERIVGARLAAIFLATAARDGAGGTAALMGVTRQWIGHPSAPFAYVGSVGPWPVAPQVWSRIEALGRRLAAEFRLIGLFGVDLILHDREPWPVEINPRYTASVEVIELARGRALLADHARACDAGAERSLENSPTSGTDRTGIVGKLILFAPAPCIFPALRRVVLPADDPFAVPALGDIPEPGTRFEAGEPVLTLFARGPTVAACRQGLRLRRARWLRRLARSKGS
jgi:predicted ATP-grasp superfamily ATP-dependent carboligase